MRASVKKQRNDYTVGWICAIAIELAAATAILDDVHPQLENPEGDTNVYKLGSIGKHNVVIACLPKYGIAQAGIVATRMQTTFTRLRFGLMVGLGGGIPSPLNDIRLGDIVVSQPTDTSGGVVHFDFGKAMENGQFVRTGSLNRPPTILLSAVMAMKSMKSDDLGREFSETAEEVAEEDSRFIYPGSDSDRLFRADYNHVPSKGRQSDTCKACSPSKIISRSERQLDCPYVHYGVVASGSQVIKDGLKRDKIGAETGALCFEMEAAGLMDDFPCLVIRGICDYSDSHKNKRWQPYSAVIAAIYAKELLLQIPLAEQSEIQAAPKNMLDILNFDIPLRVPYARSKNFVGRKRELERIHRFFKEEISDNTPQIFAIVGVGGMGKTQIALEYAYQHHHDTYTAVLWISAASEESLSGSIINILQDIVKEQALATWPESVPDYQKIASRLGIPGLIDDKGLIVVERKDLKELREALLRWLQMKGNTRWLLIVDNADDLEVVDIQQYLPTQGGGRVLITSRRPEFSSSAEQLELDGLDMDSAINLLLSLARISDRKKVKAIKSRATTLVKKLGFMPLAISHAGYFINESKLPLKDYMGIYENAFMKLQSVKPKFGWTYANDSAATTWEMSFLKVQSEDNTASLLFSMSSFLNPEEMLESLWDNHKRVEENSSLINNQRVRLLTSYSLVKVTRFGAFSVHPVVYQWARERLNQSRELRFAVMRRSVIIIGKACMNVITNGASTYCSKDERRVTSHLTYLNKYVAPRFWKPLLDSDNELERHALLESMYSIATHFHRNGYISEALKWNEMTSKGAMMELGSDHPLTLNAVHGSAVALSGLFKFQGAMKQYSRLLSSSMSLSSKLTVYHNLGTALCSAGNYEAANECLLYTLGQYQTMSGIHDMRRLCTISSIGSNYSESGKYTEAVTCYQLALNIGKLHGVFNENLELEIRMEEGIALAYERAQLTDESMARYEKTLIRRERLWGKDHLVTKKYQKFVRLRRAGITSLEVENRDLEEQLNPLVYIRLKQDGKLELDDEWLE